MKKQTLNEFINTIDYAPVLTIGQFMDSFRDGLERDGKLRAEKPVFVRTLTAVLKGDGSKSLFQRWKDTADMWGHSWYAKDSWYFPVLDVYFQDGEVRFVIDSKNFAGKRGRLDNGIGPRLIWAKLAKIRDYDGIKINTRVVVYDRNTNRTLWMYQLPRGYYSRPTAFGGGDLEIPNLFDPAWWFDANNSTGIDQSFGIGAETPEWFEELKNRSDARATPFGHQLRPAMRQRFRDAGLGESR